MKVFVANIFIFIGCCICKDIIHKCYHLVNSGKCLVFKTMALISLRIKLWPSVEVPTKRDEDGGREDQV